MCLSKSWQIWVKKNQKTVKRQKKVPKSLSKETILSRSYLFLSSRKKKKKKKRPMVKKSWNESDGKGEFKKKMASISWENCTG